MNFYSHPAPTRRPAPGVAYGESRASHRLRRPHRQAQGEALPPLRHLGPEPRNPPHQQQALALPLSFCWQAQNDQPRGLPHRHPRKSARIARRCTITGCRWEINTNKLRSAPERPRRIPSRNWLTSGMPTARHVGQRRRPTKLASIWTTTSFQALASAP